MMPIHCAGPVYGMFGAVRAGRAWLDKVRASGQAHAQHVHAPDPARSGLKESETTMQPREIRPRCTRRHPRRRVGPWLVVAVGLGVFGMGLQPVLASSPAAMPPAPSLEGSAASSGMFLIAMLNLRDAMSTARPWPREWEAVQRWAAPDRIAPSLAEVLSSHASRGVPTERDLRERFERLLPSLAARAPRHGSLTDRAMATAHGLLASVGLTEPPDQSPTDAALYSVSVRLRGGDLPGAIADAFTLDPALQPLLAGWLAQAQARLAVEQAVRETILRALTPAPHEG